MKNNGIVNIHGKDYMTVARRLELAHADKAIESVETEVINHDPVVVKAKVIIKGQLYTGISSVNEENANLVEKQNPYEVAETSAVGRALGFAGYGLIEAVASADEMVHALEIRSPKGSADKLTCAICGQPAYEKEGTSKVGKSYHAIFCSTEDKNHTQWL